MPLAKGASLLADENGSHTRNIGPSHEGATLSNRVKARLREHLVGMLPAEDFIPLPLAFVNLFFHLSRICLT